MDYDQFLKQVRELTGLDRAEAERATDATLATLAERITEGEAIDLAAQLPHDLQPSLEGSGPGESFPPEEFHRRVAERAGVPPGTAEAHARAVLSTVRDAVTEGELDHVLSQLPEDYRNLFAEPSGG